MKISEMRELRASKIGEADKLVEVADAEKRQLNEAEQKSFDSLMAEADSLAADIERREKLEAEKAKLEKVEERVSTPELQTAKDDIEVIHNYGTLKHFRGANAAKEAYQFGMWMGGLIGVRSMREKAEKMGLTYRASTEGVNTAGGFTVPAPLNAPLAYNVDLYGTFRQYADVVPMISDTAQWPRQTGDVTTYYVGENAAATESDITWEDVSLTARKLGVLSKITTELNEDSIVSIGDRIMGSMSRAIAQAEDTAGWTGTGAAATGGIDGVKNRLSTVNGVDEGGGIELAAGNLLSEVVIGDWAGMVGRLPEYAEANARWYTSKWAWGNSMQALAAAAGGNTWEMLANGQRQKVFLGYPVVICAGTMFPTSDANSQILCCFGDLSMAAMFGDRRSFSMAVKEIGDDAQYDRVSVIGFSRYDINVHNVGTSTAAGPIIGLMSAAS